MSAFADVTIKESSDGSELTSYYSKGKTAHYIDNQLTNITNIKKGLITVFNPMAKTYFQATMAEMKSLSVRFNNQAKDMEQDSKFQSFRDQQEKSVKITPTGTKKIAGYSCQGFTINVAVTETTADICLSKDVAMLLSKEADTRGMDQLMDSLDEGGSFDVLTDKISELEDKYGYLLSENISMMGSSISTEVISVSTKAINPSAFSIPSGYSKKPMPQIFKE